MTQTPNVDETLLEAATEWAAADPDQSTATELRDLIGRATGGDETAVAELVDAFDGTLQFGTAGLRGRLGPGSNRMNRVVVSRAAAGLAQYLVQTGGSTVVIGFDARRNSDVFARDTPRSWPPPVSAPTCSRGIYPHRYSPSRSTTWGRRPASW